MNQNITLASRLREVLLNGRWIANTNFKDQLENVSWQQATHKVGNLNTIAALTYHINYYLAGLVHAFEHGRLEISDKYSFDLPPITSEAGWNQLVNELLHNAEAFAKRVEELDDATMDEPFIDEKYGNYLRNIEGMIEHCYYHLGQVVMLRKIIG